MGHTLDARRKEGKSLKEKKTTGSVFVITLFPHMPHIFLFSAARKAGVFGDIIALCGQVKYQHKAPEEAYFQTQTSQTKQDNI